MNETMVRPDPAPYRIGLMEAEAALGNAEPAVSQLQSAYHARAADSQKSVSAVALARDTFRRQQDSQLVAGSSAHITVRVAD